MRYHFSTKTRQAEPCKADKEPCQYGDHFDNQEEAIFFADKQNVKDFGNFATIAKTSKSYTHSVQASHDALSTFVEKENNVDENLQLILRNLIVNESSSLQLDIISEDDEFRRVNDTLNEVHRFTLSDGSIGYFKPLREDEVLPMYSVSPTQEVINEVAAYKLSQALGEGFDHLVPETTIRHFDGNIGSIQREVKGDTAANTEDIDTSREHLVKCVVLDYLIGNMDRHSHNYMHVKPPPEFRMIDNGVSFPEKDVFSSPTLYRFGREDSIIIEDDEMNKIKPIIQKLIESKDHFGMDKYLPKSSLDHMIEKAHEIVKYEEYDESDYTWDR